MNDFPIDFRDIDNEDSALTIVEVFSEMALDQRGLKMSFANDFFTHCLNNLENPSASPKTKYYTMFMLKELSIKDTITLKLFGPLSKHPLYEHIQQMAMKTDPKKAVDQKGKNLFPSDKTTGNNLIRLVLQSLMNWGTRFASNKDKKPTRFKETLDRLNKQKVVLPKNLIYYPRKGEKAQTPQGTAAEIKKEETKKPVTNETISRQSVSVPKVKDSKEKYAAEIKFMFNKIEALLSILQDSEQAQEIQKEVASYHQKFSRDLQKIQSLEGEMLDGQPQQILHLYFKILDFFSDEKGLFNLHAQQKDYASYISGYKIAFQKIFEQSTLKKQNAAFKPQPSIQAKIKQENKPQAARPKSNVPPPPKPQKSRSQVEREKQNGIKKTQSKGPQRQNSRVAQVSKAVEVCFSRLQKASKSPNTGFAVVASSLSRQKQSGLAVRKKNPMAVSNFNKSRFGASSVSKSTIQLKGIFAHPPNSNLKFKNYQGELVLQSRQLDKTSQFVLKLQGHRRHKMSHFKSKYILFEDERIQIGYKTTQIYQKVEKFASMLLFQLFFGNKTSKTMRRLALNFQGDKESLIYTSPQTIEQTISPASQFKMQLLNIPTSIPFGEITIQLSYEIDSQTNHVSAYMPNSLLQMVSYYNIQKSKYTQMWGGCVKILKTQPFQLSHHFPPDQLRNFIPQLRQNTNYSDFARQNSTTDYELYVDVVIQQSFEGMVKINIRPDLSVVLQAGLIQNEQNSLKNFRFYLQSLAMVLKQQN